MMQLLFCKKSVNRNFSSSAIVRQIPVFKKCFSKQIYKKLTFLIFETYYK